ncbi:Clavaminate synthase-like protein [Platanthera zijinensis]|uniref:Clavaminate synthase-like protein n=1 Tax=Platanthera zijinensis TaxID=2320716 RepID=A0AAP0BJU6_9ASPA
MLEEELRQHGAILLRGFDVRSPEDFSQVVAAFGWDEFVYAGAANRIKLADRVLTVNAEPLHLFLNFHHEMALIKEYPNKIFFCCLEAPAKGGETSIIPSDFLVEKMEEKAAEALKKMEEDGITAVMTTKAWHRMFNTADEIEAEKSAMKKFICNSIKFNDEDGTMDLIYGPMSPVKEFNGKRVMWHMITEYKLAERKSKVTFGDGERIPEEAIKAYNEIVDEGSVNVKWRQGDVLVVDNLTVQHARQPGEPPRVVLVSLSH